MNEPRVGRPSLIGQVGPIGRSSRKGRSGRNGRSSRIGWQGPRGRIGARSALALFAIALGAATVATIVAPSQSIAQSGQSTSRPDTQAAATPFDLDGARVAGIDGPITAVTLDYLKRSISIAEGDGVALIVALNTPGGDVSSMRAMSEAMLAAEVPIIVWVGPQGGQAASAGTFIVLAAHAAGMAPRTTIGAASPVGSGGDDLPETVKGKITEDLSALARTFAERRGEDAAEWTEAAVRDAVSATADEALELGLIDAVADSPALLIADLDGLAVEVGDSRYVLRAASAVSGGRGSDSSDNQAIESGTSEPSAGQSGSRPTGAGSPGSDDVRAESTAGAYPRPAGDGVPTLTPIEPTAAELLLGLLAHPAVALLLLTLGLNAILIELSNPGGWVPGIIGLSALALGFYSLGVLEANFVGLAFIAGAVALFVLELKTPTSGLFTVAGLGLFVAGSVVLFSGTAFGVPWPTVIGTAGFTALFVLFVVGAALRALARQPVTGAESLMGHRAVVKRALAPRGTVLLAGELWDAVLVGGSASDGVATDPGRGDRPGGLGGSDGENIASVGLGVPVGETVVVVGREGYVLSVRRA